LGITIGPWAKPINDYVALAAGYSAEARVDTIAAKADFREGTA
jgi:hypothetical protein